MILINYYWAWILPEDAYIFAVFSMELLISFLPPSAGFLNKYIITIIAIIAAIKDKIIATMCPPDNPDFLVSLKLLIPLLNGSIVSIVVLFPFGSCES